MPGRARKVLEIDGCFWFSLEFGAELLHTIPPRIEMLALAGRLAFRREGEALWIAEADITALRRDDAQRRRLLDSVVRKRAPRPPEIGSIQPPLGSKAREDQHVLPIAGYRLPLRRRPR